MINKSRYNFDQRLTDIAQRVLSFNGIIPQNITQQLQPQRPTDFDTYQQFNNPDYQAMKNANYATEPLYFYENPQDRQTAKLSQAQAQYNLNQSLLGYPVNNSSNLNQIYLNPVNNQQHVPYQQPIMHSKHKANKAKEIVRSLDVNGFQKIIEQEESLNLPSARRSQGSSGGRGGGVESRPTTKAGEIIAKQNQMNKNNSDERLQEQQQILQQQQTYEQQQQQLRIWEQMRLEQLQFQQQVLAQQAFEQQAKLQRDREKQREQQTAQVIEPLLKNQSDILSALTNKIKDREGPRNRRNHQERGTGTSQMSKAFQEMMSENLRSLAQQQEKYNQDQLFSYRSGSNQQENNNNSAMFMPMQFIPGGFSNPMMQQPQQLQSPMLQPGQPFPGVIGLPEKFQGMNRNSSNMQSGQIPQNSMGMSGLKDMHSMMFANQKGPQDQVIQGILQDFKRG